MKGISKCFGVLSALFIIFGVSLLGSFDASALQHDYVGIPFFSPGICPSDGSLISEPDGSSCGGSSYFSISFDGDSSFDFDGFSTSVSSSYLSLSDDSSSFIYSQLYPIFDFSNSSVSASNLPRYFDTSLSTFNSSPFGSRYSFVPFDLSGKPSFSFDSLPIAYLTCGTSNGAVCPGAWAYRNYFRDQLSPYWYTANGFYRANSAVDSETGLHYSYTFSLDDLFNKPIRKFSYLSIPLHDYNGYFLNSSNLFSGRNFDFHGSFLFDGSFSWHDNISSNGSFFRVSYHAILPDGSLSSGVFADCDTDLITVPSSGHLELAFSCSSQLSDSYLSFLPFLEISGDGNYVFETDSRFSFASLLLTTDNDSTPGSSFNDNLSGGGTIIGSDDYILDSNSSDPDLSSSLANLFTFNFINPFAPIFNLFNNSTSCASIPTLAGMLHSNESTVCPWFDSNVRAILTPVLGLSSSMLVFGFAVRWLGARSGNFIEDGGGIDSENYHFENKFRRKK